ncbi:Fe-S cluster assembly protein dre2 [Penicillium canariense]|uniref:Fe-S cluster assembly protein dre2 n=1 Tax=Penicillium canariense TaxID=189055 RepID=A0A9W9I935_9EURO|nr:Fe-S cluster assembly protein dre2 [Penicillium canariense]KAJ5167222.1 Fe-S cluster assembly protein dre2 [Penicillium canariense]
MAPSFVSIDTSDDFNMAPPSGPETLHALFTTFDRQTTDLQMLDRLSTGAVTLSPNTYSLVLILTETDGSRRAEALQLLTRNVYTALVPAMKPGAKLQTQDKALTAAEAMEAIMAGLAQNEAGFEKPNFEQASAVPLKLGGRKKKTAAPAGIMMGFTTNSTPGNNHDRDDDEELINEDSLLDEEDFTRPIMPPPECQPKTGRRRRACKDCTCGLADRLEAEDKERRENADKNLNVLKLQSDDLTELDFTVEGKTGSCGSCALGDAFRCAGCPYLGLPAFKPGQEVQILNDVAQL